MTALLWPSQARGISVWIPPGINAFSLAWHPTAITENREKKAISFFIGSLSWMTRRTSVSNQLTTYQSRRLCDSATDRWYIYWYIYQSNPIFHEFSVKKKRLQILFLGKLPHKIKNSKHVFWRDSYGLGVLFGHCVEKQTQRWWPFGCFWHSWRRQHGYLSTLGSLLGPQQPLNQVLAETA